MNKEKIKMTLRKMRPILACLFGLLVIVGIVIFWENLKNASKNEAAPAETKVSTPTVRRLIDGIMVPESVKESYPLAVMVENSIDAWPLSGVSKADLVWEAPVEAGITRLMAVYADGEDVKEIGPVRSARPYYLNWALELNALYIHVGGSPEALSFINAKKIKDLNEFWNGMYFWRSSDRSAPHNVYTSTDLLTKAFENKKISSLPAYESWKYKDDEAFANRPSGGEIKIDFSSPAYAVNWKYDRQTNEYVRWQVGKIFRDKDGSEVKAKNIVVLETDISIIDNVGRRKIRTAGEGKVKVFMDGKEISGKWKNSGQTGRTKFFDNNENEISFNAGTTWIEVIKNLSGQLVY